MSRFLSPEDAIKLEHQSDDLKFASSRLAGGAYLRKALWQRLGFDDCLKKALNQRSFTAPMADALFAMVANRALAPSSKLAIEQWAADEFFLGDDQQLQVQHCYRAMDFLLETVSALIRCKRT